MTQPRLNEEKTSILVLLAVLALSSLGFAIIGLSLGSELTLDLDRKHQVDLEVIRPEAPDLEHLDEFWTKSGYRVLKRAQVNHLQVGSSHNNVVWVQGQETFVLVPQEPNLKLVSAIFELCATFLEEGWMIQLEATDHGYTIGFWSHISGQEGWVLTHLWQIELLSPHNYAYHYGGFIPVMGELFDPAGFLKGTPQAPVLALIIDDWGYFSQAAEPLISYPFPLTMAVLPHLFVSQEVSERIHEAGHEVILHQPMEAVDGSLDLGPGGITLAMSQAEVKAQLQKNVASLPVVVGINNHMGSLVTADHAAMTNVLEVVGELGLFFVDSRTSNSSVVGDVASELGVPYGVNNLFIDNENDIEKIKTQVRAGLALAQKQGHAVMIGHVRPTTADALWEMIPEFLDSGVQLVPISSLLF